MRPPLPVSFLVCRLALPAEAHFQAPLLCLGFGPPLLVSPVSAAPSDTPDSHAMPLTSREACHLPLHHDRRTGSRPGLVSQHRTALGYSFPAGQARWWGGEAARPRGHQGPGGSSLNCLTSTLRGKYQTPPPARGPLSQLGFLLEPQPLAFQREGKGRAWLHNGKDPPAKCTPTHLPQRKRSHLQQVAGIEPNFKVL